MKLPRDGVFAGTGITVTEFARCLGVTRVALSRVLNGKAAISAGMAVSLRAALGGARRRGCTCRPITISDTRNAR